MPSVPPLPNVFPVRRALNAGCEPRVFALSVCVASAHAPGFVEGG